VINRFKKNIHVVVIGSVGIILILYLLVYLSIQSVQLNRFVGSTNRVVTQLHELQVSMKCLKCECDFFHKLFPHWLDVANECDVDLAKLKAQADALWLSSAVKKRLQLSLDSWERTNKQISIASNLFQQMEERNILGGKWKSRSLYDIYEKLLHNVSSEDDIRLAKKMIRMFDEIDHELSVTHTSLASVSVYANKKSESFTVMVTSGLVILLITLVVLGAMILYKVNLLNTSLIEQVAERLQTENALRRSEENLKITLNSIGDAVIATDREGIVTRINPIAERLLGGNGRTIVGVPLEEIYKPIEHKTLQPSECLVGTALKTGEVLVPADYKLLPMQTGENVYISESAAPIKNIQGELVGGVLVFRNITKQVKMEEQLQHSHKMESIGQLAGGIAHDFNNMLGGIVGAAELLDMKLETDRHLKKYVDIILNASQRAASLTQQLLDFSRKGKKYSIALNVHKACEHAIDILLHSIDKRISIKTSFRADSFTINGDFSQIQNMFLNVGLNSRDAMPEGGEISFKTKNLLVDKYWLDNHQVDLPAGNYIQIDVMDSGTGISEEVKKRIFEPFFTTKEEGQGTGLGLAAVYGTVASHKGYISVESQEGEGTCLHILLPVIKYIEKPQQEGSLTPGTRGGCVLLVDDEEIVRDTGYDLLEALGYSVIVAKDGKEGVELFKQFHEKITFVILDVIMPVMNGRDAFREIRAVKPNIRVLLSSGYTKDAKIHLIQDEEGVAFLKKPYTLDELKQSVDRLLFS
jgi:PAS domain S-box-containing protein